jgi:uncharacterized protein GlcG (DUF336 family)
LSDVGFDRGRKGNNEDGGFDKIMGDELMKVTGPGGAAYGLGNTNGGRFTTFGGGLPILNEKGEIVGGIGASTGTPAQDQEVVTAGKETVERVLREEGGRVKAKL